MKRKTESGRCRYCSAPRRCPAYRSTCSHCHKLNHFARVCQQRQRHAIKTFKVQEDCSEDSQEDNDHKERLSYFTPIYIGRLDDDEWTEKLTIDLVQTSFKLDTGASVNVLPMQRSRQSHILTTQSLTNQEVGQSKLNIRETTPTQSCLFAK